MSRAHLDYSRVNALIAPHLGLDVTTPAEGEEWRVVARSPNYAVSSHGRVMRIAGAKGARVGRILSQFRHSAGYLQVTLHDKGQTAALVHQLVCEAFHGPCPSPLHEVAHKDGSRTNARADNLVWKTSSGNKADMHLHGTARVGEKNNLAKYSADVIRAVREAKGSCREVGCKFGMSPSNVSRIRLRQLWGHI